MPALQLQIAESRIYRCLHILLCLLLAASLYRIHQRGYSVLAMLLLPAVGQACWRLARQRLAGCIVSWRNGQWFVGEIDRVRAMELLPVSTCVGNLTYLAWLDSGVGRRQDILLFPDSLSQQDLRRLRLRLGLQR